MVRASYPVLEVKDQSMDFRHCISFFRRNWKMNPCPQSLTIGPPFIGYNHRIGINHLIHSLEISSLLKSAIGLALARIIRALPSLLTSGLNSTAISTFFLLPLERPLLRAQIRRSRFHRLRQVRQVTPHQKQTWPAGPFV